jgi:DNA-binding response OmpR family regulator
MGFIGLRVLLVEDDATLGELLSANLRSHGHDVSWVWTGAAGLARAEENPMDLVLLDLGLPDLDGIEVCRQVRRDRPNCLLIILTARSAEMDVVLGLEAGADDYMVKPIRMAELHARIRAHLRATAGGSARSSLRTIGDLVLDLPHRRVTVGGTELFLRLKEYDLLARLTAQPDVPLSRETLMSDVWDENWAGPTKTLDVHIATLRRKIREIADATRANVPEIVTIRGHGYRLQLPRRAPDART